MTTSRHPLSKVDTAWLRMDSPNNPMVVTGLLFFDGPLNMERLRRVLIKRLLPHERFRQRVVNPLRDLRAPAWENDPNFDLGSHLHHVALPSPGGDRELQDLVGDLMSTRLDRSRPLWQMHVVDGWGDGTVLVSRIHHCIADGIALIRVLLSLTDESAALVPSRSSRHPRPEADSSFFGAAMHTSRHVLHESWRSMSNPRIAYSAARFVADSARAFVRVSTLPFEPGTALRGPLGPRKRPVWSEPIALDEVKVIARDVHGTVNDVLLTAATGALRAYLLQQGDDPSNLRLHATVPVNLRHTEPSITLGNRFGLVYPELPVHARAPLERLRLVKAQMDSIKATPEAIMSIVVLDALGRSPALVERMAISLFTSKSSAVITNVPGPSTPHFLAGSRVERILFWAPPSGSVAMSFSIVSYAGLVSVGIATDIGVIPDPETIVNAFHAELRALVDAPRNVRGNRTGPTTRTRKTTATSAGRR